MRWMDIGWTDGRTIREIVGLLGMGGEEADRRWLRPRYLDIRC